jgi:hypothetical protein
MWGRDDDLECSVVDDGINWEREESSLHSTWKIKKEKKRMQNR